MGRASVSVRTVRSRRRGKKWSPVLDEWASTVHQNVATNTTVTEFHAICANSANIGTAPTATVIKCGNFKCSFECECGAGNYNAVTGVAFIMFVPQGVTPDADYPKQHPEYILAWRAFNPAGSVSATTIQSRLKRNLNSGDSVVFLYKIFNASGALITFQVHTTSTYVCCNN